MDMKKKFYSMVAVLLMVVAAQAQDEYTVVKYSGARPNIIDFVNAIFTMEDLGESMNNMAANWKLYRQNKTLHEGATILTDVPNGYVRFDQRYDDTDDHSHGYIEICYWNCADNKHKLVAINDGYELNGKPIETQYSGLWFYSYDNDSHRLSYVNDIDFGVRVETSDVVTYELPRKGKDIKAVIHASNRPFNIMMKWNGTKFKQVRE